LALLNRADKLFYRFCTFFPTVTLLIQIIMLGISEHNRNVDRNNSLVDMFLADEAIHETRLKKSLQHWYVNVHLVAVVQSD
jgi:hypothetical protein